MDLAKPRPALFRALGTNDPPAKVTVGGIECSLVEIFKHDSWAATALYQHSEFQVTIKFNRRQRIGLLPMRWLGTYLAKHEAKLLNLLADLPNVPMVLGQVAIDGVVQSNAVARVFLPGHPLKHKECPSPEFFEELDRLLAIMHSRRIAYVDLHKRENVIVGEQKQPILIDFQISMHLPDRWWVKCTPLPWILRLLQSSDRYHAIKHKEKARLATENEQDKAIDQARPFWIRLHRLVAVPLRTMRRKLLVLLGIRKGEGRVESERFVEVGLRD